MRGLLCWLLLLFCCTALCSAADGSWSINPPNVPGLTCDPLGFHYTVYPQGDGQRSVRLAALDRQGGAHVLSSRRDCGTWIDEQLGGSISLHAFSDGCYVYEKNDENVLTILVEQEYNPGNWSFPQRKVLRCPMLGDGSLEHCDVPNTNRTACAGPSASLESCNNQGCCFDDEQINPCYYGNKVVIRCTQNGRFSVGISKDFMKPPLQLDSVRTITGEEACRPLLKTDALVLFQFNVSTCGTTSKEMAGLVIHETIILAEMDVQKDNGTSIRLHIQCSLDSRDEPMKNMDSPTSSPPSEALTLRMRIAEEKRAMDKAASNKTILVLPQRPLYVPTAEDTEASGKGMLLPTGSTVPTGLQDKEWARILLVVCVLAALLIGIYVIKRRPKMPNVDNSV